MGIWSKTSIEDILNAASRGNGLRRSLGATNLVTMGLGAVIGAGVFTLTGIAAANYAGPAIVWSLLLASVGCALAGLCYSEFASMLPVAGSAYAYAYATVGELPAWIIGWDLILEYAVGAATVASGWSATLASLLSGVGVTLSPRLLASPFEMVVLADGLQQRAWFNLPALLIVVVVSLLLIRGTRESARVNTIIVILKLAVLLVFIVVGWHYIDKRNFTPFIPPSLGAGHFGWSGIVRGAGVIFFAYIGFDAVSTAAQEAKNPKRDMPIGIIGSLGLCAVLFVLYAHCLTGIVNYRQLNVASPLAVALDAMHLPWLGFLMKIAILAGLTSVLLVMLMGQSRILYAMSRDGLLPCQIGMLHPRHKTPWISNALVMVIVGLFAALGPVAVVSEMTSIGTLFAFVLVCLGVLIMRVTYPSLTRPFRTPLVPWVPVAGLALNLMLMFGLGWSNWVRLIGWLVVGLFVYCFYGRLHSLPSSPLRETPSETMASHQYAVEPRR